MASSHHPITTTSSTAAFHHPPPTYGSDPTTTLNTTFVQADPSSFRAVVQKLTGASDDPSSPKLPLTLPSRLTTAATDISPKKPSFKLHERRHAGAARKMTDLSIGVVLTQRPAVLFSPSPSSSSSSSPSCCYGHRTSRGLVGTVMAASSPVSPLEMLEGKAIAKEGFLIHPSPLSTPTGSSSTAPELLPLFPLHSPSCSDHK